MGAHLTFHQCRDLFLDLLADPSSSHPIVSHHDGSLQSAHDKPTPHACVIDVYQAASRVTYDIIGEVAIDHHFDALSRPGGPGGRLFEKYERMQQLVTGSAATRQDLALLFPILEWIAVGASIDYHSWFQPTENTKRVQEAMGPLEDLAKRKIEERRQEVKEGKRSESRDLLSLMRESTEHLHNPLPRST
jgi:cytochrome P450